MHKFSERLKELRLERDLSQDKLAEVIGMSQNSITYWENLKRVPNANAIIALAKFFDVSSDYLLGLKDTFN